MKKILFLLLCILAGAQTVNAQEAYAEFDTDTYWLKFYYDDKKASRQGITFSIGGMPAWSDGVNAKVTNVVFDESFKNFRPKSTAYWFYGMKSLQNIACIHYLNTSEVREFNYMFSEVPLTVLDLSTFDTSSAVYMNDMFRDCRNLNTIDVSSFNTENVETMERMFTGCHNLRNLDVSNFRTNSLRYANSMFLDCKSLIVLDLSGFNTGNLSSCKYMFSGCYALEKIHVSDKWDVSGLTSTNTERMFYGCYELVGGAGTTFDANHIDGSYAHIDGGTANPGYLTGPPPSPYANYNNGTLTFYYDNLRSTRAGKTYSLNSGTTNPGWFTEGISASITKVVFDPSFANARPTSTYYWFSGCTNLTSITGWENLNTSEVTNMREMFSDCRKLTNLNLNQFNTSKVTNMNGMFQSCKALKKLSFSYLFSTTNVTDMSYMFYDCSAMTSFDLSYFNTSKVTDMRYMFYECDAVTTLDLSTFDTGNVTNMAYMFSECDNLTTINISNGWSTAKVTVSNSSYGMFLNTKKIRGMQGTTYNASYVDKTYARLDEGTSKPGYLSTKKWGLWIGGVEVTDMNYSNIPITSGKAVYNRANTLSLTDATIDGNSTYGSIYCTNDYLTVIVNGTCTLNRTVKFTGADLYFTSNKDTDVLNVKSYFDFKGSLRFYNRKTVISTSASYMFMGDGTTSKLEFGPNASMIGTNNTQVMSGVTDFTLKSPTTLLLGVMGMPDADVQFSSEDQTLVVVSGSTQTALARTIAIGREHFIWIAGTQVTSLNLTDVLGDGKISYDEDTYTLTLNGANITSSEAHGIETRMSNVNMKINLKGQNSITSSQVGIRMTKSFDDGPLTFLGGGTLSIKGDVMALQAYTDFELKDGVKITAECTGNGYGIQGRKRSSDDELPTLLMSGTGTELRAKGGANGSVVTLHALGNGVEIAEPTGATLAEDIGVVLNSSMVSNEWVVFKCSNSYDLNGDGKVSTADIQVIINEMKKPQASQNMSYDLNNDGKISTADIQVIINEMKK